jgi:hypothetical protein
MPPLRPALGDPPPLGKKASRPRLRSWKGRSSSEGRRSDLRGNAHRGEHWLSFILPDEQALPALTAIPARSNWASRLALACAGEATAPMSAFADCPRR